MISCRRFTTAFFTALPAAFFFVPVVAREDMRREYYWISLLAGVSILLGSALMLGFFQPLWLRPKWLWILAAGWLAMFFALFATAVVNATPLCVGQDNGDGNNSFGRCMGHVMLYAFFYGIPYTVLLIVSAFIGNWAMKMFR